jgi:formimidoylglutamate deiminase
VHGSTRFWLPDLIYWDGEIKAGLALEVGGDGTIAGVVPAEQALRPIQLRGQALLPGLVNAHSHAFQRLIRGRTEYVAEGRAQDDFWSWRELMYRAACALEPEEVYTASRQAFLEMALAGITAVGEFHYLHHRPDGGPYDDPNELAMQVIRAATDVGIRIALLRVGYARAGHRVPANPRQARFIDPAAERFLGAAESLQQATRADPRVTVGLAPHSVRAVPKQWLEAAAGWSGGPLHVHVAEQPAEIDACLAEHRHRPVELLQQVGLLGPRFTGVHAIHLSKEEIAALGASGSNLCACPSTERNLGDGVIAADALLAQGASLSLGSDSQATIDLLDEARQLESHLRLVRLRRSVLDPGGGHPDGLGRRLFDIASVGGARSLGLDTGRLRVGAPADFFTVALEHPSLVGAARDTLLSSVVFGAGTAAIREVCVGGRNIVSGGRHPLRAQSAEAFGNVCRRIFG